MSSESELQLVKDRSNPEHAQARGHNKRVRDKYPDTWAKSIITDKVLAEWIIERKGDKCPYCEKPVKEVDHKLPLSKGGDHEISNLQMLCMDCNRSKHDMTDAEFAEFKKNSPKIGLSLRDYGIEYRHLKDKMNRFRTRSLFKEFWIKTEDDSLVPIFVCRGEEDRDGLISLKRVYMTIGDPTEYRFAKAIFGDHRHWRHLCKLPWFSVFAKEWRLELKAKLRSDAVAALLELKDGNIQAIKALASEDYPFASYIDGHETKRRRAGRPNKEAKPEIDDEVFEGDAARMGLNG
jgi:5-methylcytosine-specific restriction endonuclease McrA